MRTIEERALAYSEQVVNDTPFDVINGKVCVWQEDKDICEVARKAYIDGALEQKEIDDNRYIESLSKILKSVKKDTIDDACEWLSNYFVVKHEGMTAQGCDAFLKEFRKAMEE